MTNPTDIPMNWQDGAQTTPEAPSQEDINAALEILDQNYAEIEAAYNSGEIDQETYDKLSEAVKTMREKMERGEMPELPFNPNEPMPVVLGMVAAHMVSIFSAIGGSLWTVDDPERLSDIMGRNSIPRTLTPASGLREIGLLTPAAGTLMVAERVSKEVVDDPSKDRWSGHPDVTQPMQGDKDAEGEDIYMRTHTFHLSDPEETEDNPWEDVEAFLRRIASENPTRGQYAIVEKASDLDQKPAGQEHPDHYVLFGIFHTDEDDGDQIVIETFPHPEDAQFWDTVDKPVSGPTIVAADSSTDPAEQGSIATAAAASWGTNPWDLVVSYAPVPPRPGTPEAEEWQKAMDAAAEAARQAAEQGNQA